MNRLAWVLCLAMGIAGCQPGAQGNESGLCTVVCRCTQTLPGQQRACTNECIAEIETEEISDSCVSCVFENANACGDLVQRCFEDPFSPCSTRPQTDIPDAGILIDAF